MIKIEIISFNDIPTTQPLYSCFNELGGNIGRAEGNTLVLNDPTKTISRVHATISFQMGQFFIRGLGRLPLHLNDLQLANGQDTPIHVGDIIQIGPYHLKVITDTDAIPQSMSKESFVKAPTVDFDPFADLAPIKNDLLGGIEVKPYSSGDLGLVNFPQDQKKSGSGITDIINPKNSLLDSANKSTSIDDPLLAMGFPSEKASSSQHFNDGQVMRASMPPIRHKETIKDDPLAAMGFPPDAPIPTPPNSPPAAKPAENIAFTQQPLGSGSSTTDEALMHAFLSGAGITNLSGSVKLTPEFMHSMGELFRESIQGTLDLLAIRAELKKAVRAEHTLIVAKENNPLKFSPNVEMALNHLLNDQGAVQGFMDPKQSLKDAYYDLSAHHFGLMAGMRGTLQDILKRLDPVRLEKQLTQKTFMDSLFSANQKAKLWSLFAEQYQEISREIQEDSRTVFSNSFLQEYEAQVNRFKKDK